MDLRERTESDLRHPWEQARATFFRRLIASCVDPAGLARVLDIGAGDGWLALELRADLASDATIVCWDINYRPEDLRLPSGRGIERAVVPPETSFSLVLLLDVLEHIADDAGFLADVVLPRLSPGGTLVASVPSYPSLYSEHDRMLLHERRYRPVEFVHLLQQHVDVQATGSLFTSLLLPRAMTVLLERLGCGREPRGVGAWRGGQAITAAVTSVLEADARMGLALHRRGIRLPGLSTWAVARRPGPS
jgi:SAM-dependent methyltransferase